MYGKNNQLNFRSILIYFGFKQEHCSIHTICLLRSNGKCNIIKLNELRIKYNRFKPNKYFFHLISKIDSANLLFIAPPLKIRFWAPVERVETTIFNPRVESRYFNPHHSYSQSDSQKSCYEK